ncbi:MAG: DUF5110 domain-containing protein [Spirochaetaceae bacterium]|nr:DUF5110 domain-containing protein [Spirochaetaceae bacterium]
MPEYKVNGNIVNFKNVRLSIITDRLIRFEYSKDKKFVDDQSLMVVNRNYHECEFNVEVRDKFIYISTAYLVVECNGEEFSSFGLSVQLKHSLKSTLCLWRYGDKVDNLGGTARTLDTINGECELEDGIFSKSGYAIIDDSFSMLLNENFVKSREKGKKDLYFFGYGIDFVQGLKDYYYISGKTPMIPRYALGNWWSRYYKYTSENYLSLMDEFKINDIPLSVSVIDMDWHLVDIDPKLGTGWTGYTWNKEFFPNPKEFLEDLHKRGLKVTLNDHPADGIRAYEDNYNRLAESMGIDPKTSQTILFDASNIDFLNKFQDNILEPLERDGIDFWWIDWQQGSASKVEGLDPLIALNLTRFNSSRNKGVRPLIFSRYSGPGSHRLPLGFSGDTVISWESLAFQPKFTACASNIGYGWWSHDIGGHMHGYKDNELEIRWYQVGVFSPINRLHSSNSLFTSKEPWRYERETNRIMSEFLRLRHKLIPYLYTMNYLSYKKDIPLVRPMYYYNGNDERSFEVETQYYFGSSMIVAPIVSKSIPNLLMSKVKVYLPKGNYYDFFNSRLYRGDRVINMFRTLDELPILIREGEIIPLTNEGRAEKNPDELILNIYMGVNGRFNLYEDDNISDSYKDNICCRTLFENNWDKKEFVINKVIGDLSLIPKERSYRLVFVGIENSIVSVTNDKNNIKYCGYYDENKKELIVLLNNISTCDRICINFNSDISLSTRDLNNDLFELLDQVEIEIDLKDLIYKTITTTTIENAICGLISLDLDKNLFECICELLLAN